MCCKVGLRLKHGPFSLIFTVQTAHAECLRQNTLTMHWYRMTRLALRIAKNGKSACGSYTEFTFTGVTGWQGGHVSKLRNHKEVKRLQASYTGYMN